MTTLTEHHHVVTGDEGPFELRNHSGFETDDARPRVTTLPERGQQVVADPSRTVRCTCPLARSSPTVRGDGCRVSVGCEVVAEGLLWHPHPRYSARLTGGMSAPWARGPGWEPGLTGPFRDAVGSQARPTAPQGSRCVVAAATRHDADQDV